MDQTVGSDEASLQRSSRRPPCKPLPYHPVTERQLASMGRLSSVGALEGRCCYVCKISLVFLSLSHLVN